jgi:hypothetical protein
MADRARAPQPQGQQQGARPPGAPGPGGGSVLWPMVGKYPASLHVELAAVARPPPTITVTEPHRNIRPMLPAGYGSGFETSEHGRAGVGSSSPAGTGHRKRRARLMNASPGLPPCAPCRQDVG